MQHWQFTTLDLRQQPPPPAWGVTVVEDRLAALADAWRARPLPLPSYDLPGIAAPRSPAHWFDYAGLSICVAACLWPPEGEDEWTVTYEGAELTDMPALFACFSRGLPRREQGYDLEALLAWTGADWAAFFAGRGTLQLRSLRRHRLVLVAETLRADWGGTFANLVEDCGFDGPAIARCLVDRVPGFRDMTPTAAGLLPFNKLAHLAVSFMTRVEGAALTGLDHFPAFPDYMLPRNLRHHGVLRYSERLAHAVDTRTPIEHDGPWECALRWSVVYAVARLRDELARRGNPASPIAIDYALWHAAALGDDREAMGPHHRCLTMAY